MLLDGRGQDIGFPHCGQSHILGYRSVEIVVLAIQLPSDELVTVQGRVCGLLDLSSLLDGLQVNLRTVAGIEFDGVEDRFWSFVLLPCGGQNDIRGDWGVPVVVLAVQLPSGESVSGTLRVGRTCGLITFLDFLRWDVGSAARIERDREQGRGFLSPRCGEGDVAGDWSVPIIGLSVQQPALEVVSFTGWVCGLDGFLPLIDGLLADFRPSGRVECDRVAFRLGLLVFNPCGLQGDVGCDGKVEIVWFAVQRPP